MNDFEKIHEQESNEKTAFILMLGELSSKLSNIIDLLAKNNQKFELIKTKLEIFEKEKSELEKQKRYLPITSADYD